MGGPYLGHLDDKRAFELLVRECICNSELFGMLCDVDVVLLCCFVDVGISIMLVMFYDMVEKNRALK